MTKRIALPLVLLGAVLAAGWGLRAWLGPIDPSVASPSGAQAHTRVDPREERRERLEEESRSLMPELLSGVALGMRLPDLRDARSGRIRPYLDPQEREALRWSETLGNGSQVIYGFGQGPEPHLREVQIASLLPSHQALGPHLQAMNDRYGVPNGIWDCPATGQVPTRRFTWRHDETTVSDVILMYGERVSLTLYIATNGQISRSLAMANCRPVAADQIDAFPIATPEQVRALQERP